MPKIPNIANVKCFMSSASKKRFKQSNFTSCTGFTCDSTQRLRQPHDIKKTGGLSFLSSSGHRYASLTLATPKAAYLTDFPSLDKTPKVQYNTQLMHDADYLLSCASKN